MQLQLDQIEKEILIVMIDQKVNELKNLSQYIVFNEKSIFDRIRALNSLKSKLIQK